MLPTVQYINLLDVIIIFVIDDAKREVSSDSSTTTNMTDSNTTTNITEIEEVSIDVAYFYTFSSVTNCSELSFLCKQFTLKPLFVIN